MISGGRVWVGFGGVDIVTFVLSQVELRLIMAKA